MAIGAIFGGAAGNPGDVVTINGDTGSVTGPVITLTGDGTGLTFSGAGTTMTLGGDLGVANGGTGNTTFTAYSVICAGTTATGAFQNVSGLGTSGQILTSNGAASLPTWQNATAPSITFTGDTGTPFSNSAVTIFTNHTSNASGSTVLFDASTPNITLQVTDSNSNTLLGKSAGSASVSGAANAGFGQQSLSAITGGSYNACFGALSGESLGSGSTNTFVGGAAGYIIQTGANNVAIGYVTGGSLVSGNNNIFLGTTSGSAYTSSESNNILIGTNVPGIVAESNAIHLGLVGAHDKCFVAGISGVTAVGSPVGVNAVSGQLSDLGFGTAGQIFTSNGNGVSPTWQNASSGITFTGDTGTPFSTNSVTIFANHTVNACGSSVLFDASTPNITLKVTDSSQNTIIGNGSGISGFGSGNSVLGYNCLMNVTNSGTNNCAMGYQALKSLGTGVANVAIGYNALQNVFGSSNNVAIGNSAGLFIQGSNNTILGFNAYSAGGPPSGDNNIVIGQSAGSVYTGSESNNIIIGHDGVVTTDNNVIRIGTYGAGSGQQNKTYIAACYANPGTANAFVGELSGSMSASGAYNTSVGNSALTAITTGSYNVAMGYQALNQADISNSNVALGYRALSGGPNLGDNVCIGSNAGLFLGASGSCVQNIVIGSNAWNNSFNGNNNIILGYTAGSNYHNMTESNNILLSNAGVLGESNVIHIGTHGTGTGQQSTCFVAGISGNTATTSPVVVGLDTSTQQLLQTTITAGTGISITPAGGTITIATTGTTTLTVTSVNNAASPYTILGTDDYLACQTSTGAITLRLPNAPTTGRVYVIKDSNGAAATSNISITTVGGTVTIDGATTYTMNVNYQSVSVIFTGTNYEVL